MRICMDWSTVTFDWNQARAFLVTAEEGSLSAAARALGMAQPTLGRQVSALEAALGVALFERAGRGLTLTPAGLDLVEHVRAMGEAATRVSMIASGRSQDIEGPICITASEVYSSALLPPFVSRLRRDYPGIEIEIVATNEVRDLRRREADIAIRSGRPSQPDLIARKITDDRARLYAAPDYLRQIGNPTRPEDLSRGDFIGFDRNDLLLKGLNALGLSLTMANFPVISSSHSVHWALVRAGVGIGIFPAHMGDADPAVTDALPALPAIDVPVWLAAHRDLATSRRVRLVFDLLAGYLPGAIHRTAATD